MRNNGYCAMVLAGVVLAGLAAAAQDISLTAMPTSSRVLYLGDTATLRIWVRNLSAETFDGTLTLELKDYHGTPAGEVTEPVAGLPPDTVRMVTLNLAVDRVGYFSIDATVYAGSTLVVQQGRLWSLAVFAPGDDFPANSPFGTYTIGNTAILADIVPKGFYENMAQMGARWGTIDTWWSLLEPVEGGYDWNYYDPWFNAALAAGITPIPHLFGIPRWLSSRPDLDNYWAYPPTDWAKWERFVEDFVERYQDWLVYLRIWNEANVGYWMGSPAQYGQLVIHASQAAKRVKPDIKIIIDTVADIAQDVIPFLNAVDAAGATPYWDINGIHNYWLNNTNHPERTSFVAVYENAIEWTHAHNPAAEVWDTEFACMADNWGTWWKGVGETRQAQWLARAHVLGFSLGLNKMFWFPGYSWPDPTTPPYYNPAGLLRLDLTPRPAYVAYHTMAVALSRASYYGALSLGTDQFCRIFGTPDGYVTALWSVDAYHAGQARLYFKRAEEVSVMTIMGETRPGQASWDFGEFTVPFDDNLLFVFSKSAPELTPLEADGEMPVAGTLGLAFLICALAGAIHCRRGSDPGGGVSGTLLDGPRQSSEGSR